MVEEPMLTADITTTKKQYNKEKTEPTLWKVILGIQEK